MALKSSAAAIMLAGYRMLNGLFAIKDGQAPRAGCGVELGPLNQKCRTYSIVDGHGAEQL